MLWGAPAFAQPGGMGGGGGMGGMPAGPGAGGGQGKDKKEGPAEEAPKDKQALRPVEPIPAQPRRFRRVQLFELHGYMRLRGDYFHRLDLGQTLQTPSHGYSATTDPDLYNKFFPPPSTHAETSEEGPSVNGGHCVTSLTAQGVNAQKVTTRCGRRNGIASANMRLRLEPTLHITDSVKVHTTIDALDNVVLGSTPDSFYGNDPWAPIDMFTRTQVPPSAGINGFSDSLVVKRAYGEIRFGWGLNLEFGRMPHHWGLGIVANHGNGYSRNEQGDIVRQLDTDYGDSIDSVRMSFNFGKDRRKTHKLTFSWDWAASGPTTAQLLGPTWASGATTGQAFSAEKFDNVYQWRLSIERRDDPDMLRRKLSLGRPVVNYGFAAWVRYQPIDRAVGSPGLGDGLGSNPTWSDFNAGTGRNGNPLGNGDLDREGDSGLQNYTNLLVQRKALMVTPDLWFRVNWRTLRVELEMAGVLGQFNVRNNLDPSDPNADRPLEDTNFNIDSEVSDMEKRYLAQMGYALEFKYGFFKDRFHVGLDHGFASGDDAGALDLNPQNPLNPGGNSAMTAFRFNPAYMQDLLLFRELMGTASNAAYFKPWAAFYFFQNNFSARLDLEYAFAHQRASTPGNKLNWGLEIDGAFRYHDVREPIFFQLQYGVMFPFAGFNRPADLYVSEDASVLIPNDGDAKAAQTIQAQVGIRF